MPAYDKSDVWMVSLLSDPLRSLLEHLAAGEADGSAYEDAVSAIALYVYAMHPGDLAADAELSRDGAKVAAATHCAAAVGNDALTSPYLRASVQGILVALLAEQYREAEPGSPEKRRVFNSILQHKNSFMAQLAVWFEANDAHSESSLIPIGATGAIKGIGQFFADGAPQHARTPQEAELRQIADDNMRGLALASSELAKVDGNLVEFQQQVQRRVDDFHDETVRILESDQVDVGEALTTHSRSLQHQWSENVKQASEYPFPAAGRSFRALVRAMEVALGAILWMHGLSWLFLAILQWFGSKVPASLFAPGSKSLTWQLARKSQLSSFITLPLLGAAYYFLPDDKSALMLELQEQAAAADLAKLRARGFFKRLAWGLFWLGMTTGMYVIGAFWLGVCGLYSVIYKTPVQGTFAPSSRAASPGDAGLGAKATSGIVAVTMGVWMTAPELANFLVARYFPQASPGLGEA